MPFDSLGNGDDNNEDGGEQWRCPVNPLPQQIKWTLILKWCVPLMLYVIAMMVFLVYDEITNLFYRLLRRERRHRQLSS